MPKETQKKVKLELVGLDGNGFMLIGAFQRQARKEKWLKEEIDEIVHDAMSGDYDHLLRTLQEVCESPDLPDGQDYNDEDEEYPDEE